MRGAEEAEVLERLCARRRLILAPDAQRMVELNPAHLAPLAVHPEIGLRKGEIRFGPSARTRVRIQSLPEPRRRITTGDDELPGLAVAPGRRQLSQVQDAPDGLIGNRLGPEPPGAITRPQDF